MLNASSRILSMIADDGLPVVNLQEYERINDQFFSALFASLASDYKYSFEDYNTVVASMSDHKLSIEPESLFVASEKPQLVFRCIIAANSESKPYTEESVKGMIPIQANVFQDSNEAIWKIVGEGENRQLVQITKENYSDLLAARRARNTLVADLQDFYVPYQDGDYAFFFNPELEAMDFGTVIKGKKDDFVLSRRAKNTVKVHPSQIVEAASDDNAPAIKRKDFFEQNKPINDYLEFVAQLHSKKSDQYKKVEKMIKESAGRVR